MELSDSQLFHDWYIPVAILSLCSSRPTFTLERLLELLTARRCHDDLVRIRSALAAIELGSMHGEGRVTAYWANELIPLEYGNAPSLSSM